MKDMKLVEVDTAASILQAMAETIERLERYWPASRRGSNATRELEYLKSQRAAASQCLDDARSEPTP